MERDRLWIVMNDRFRPDDTGISYCGMTLYTKDISIIGILITLVFMHIKEILSLFGFLLFRLCIIWKYMGHTPTLDLI